MRHRWRSGILYEIGHVRLDDYQLTLHEVHSQGIGHGDLTCKNVLINDQGDACITDFGLSMIIIEFDGTHYVTSTVGGAMRYRAPELLPSNAAEIMSDGFQFTAVLTPACDIWSLASVILQVCSSKFAKICL